LGEEPRVGTDAIRGEHSSRKGNWITNGERGFRHTGRGGRKFVEVEIGGYLGAEVEKLIGVLQHK